MTGLFTSYVFENGVFGVRYTVTEPEWGLALHTHDTHCHTIECVHGPVVVWGLDWHKHLSPGEVFNEYDGTKPHAISALGPATWVNWYPSEPFSTYEEFSSQGEYAADMPVVVPEWVIKTKGPT